MLKGRDWLRKAQKRLIHKHGPGYCGLYENQLSLFSLNSAHGSTKCQNRVQNDSSPDTQPNL